MRCRCRYINSFAELRTRGEAHRSLCANGANVVTVARILGLGTYPIGQPIHGGQRRVAAFKRFYECQGFTYDYACVYHPAHYGPTDVGPNDYELDTSKSELWHTYAIGDVMAGRQAADDPRTFHHFASVVERTAPDAIELEQPFMWPLARRLRQTLGTSKPVLIYSSQNVEAPLKRTILNQSPFRDEVCAEIDQMEADLAREADLIICVSPIDQQFYRDQLKSSSKIIVVPNGVDRPVSHSMNRLPEGLSEFKGRRYLMTVSSAHVPTLDGMFHYVINGGVFCTPPAPSIAICGGIGRPIFEHPEYQRCVVANKQRVRFFFHPSDAELAEVKRSCHGVFVPIRSGGGTNLKTAEALALGKWVVATSTALRGFERFSDADGVIVADTAADFRRAMRQVLQRPPLEITECSRAARDSLYWDRCFQDSDLPSFLAHA